MKTRRVVSQILYWNVVLASVILGSIYLFADSFMSYHAAAIGSSWSELESGLQTLLLALMRVAAGGWLALAAAISAMIVFAFRKEAAWSFWVIPAIALIYYVPNLIATLVVTANTPATGPWYGNAAAIITASLGFVISPRAGEQRAS